MRGDVNKNENKNPAVDAKNQSGLDSPPAKTGNPMVPSSRYNTTQRNDSRGPIKPPIKKIPIV